MHDLVENALTLLKKKGWTLATAESCTGGLVAAALTDVPGASAVFERGVITYSNAAKIELLDVPTSIIEREGAVSAACAEFMARGALSRSGTDIAISVTGIAGPEGGSAKKPVGLVFIGYALKSGISGSAEFHFSGSRSDIRIRAAREALKKIVEEVRKDKPGS